MEARPCVAGLAVRHDGELSQCDTFLFSRDSACGNLLAGFTPLLDDSCTVPACSFIATRGDIVRKRFDDSGQDTTGEPYCIRSSMPLKAALSFRAFLISSQLT